MTATSPPPIDRDLKCDGCEYNLRGLSIDSRCPECGRSIAQTIATSADQRVSCEHLDLACWLTSTLIVECLAAIGGGMFTLVSGVRSLLVGTALLIFAWVLGIAAFCLVAWIHRERQPIRFRWNWFARYIGLIVAGVSIASTFTRIQISSSTYELLPLLFCSMLPIAVSPVPAISLFIMCRRCRWNAIGWLNLVVALASAIIATWLACVVFRDIRGVRDPMVFAILPIPGVDYANVFAAMFQFMSMNRFSMGLLALLSVSIRCIWLVLMVVTASRFARVVACRRQPDAGGRMPASSRP